MGQRIIVETDYSEPTLISDFNWIYKRIKDHSQNIMDVSNYLFNLLKYIGFSYKELLLRHLVCLVSNYVFTFLI